MDSYRGQSEGKIECGQFQTFYRIFGNTNGKRNPLVVVHGGPGLGHDYLLGLSRLAGPERAVVFYDQAGCGRSTALRGMGRDYWTVDHFLDELDSLISGLGIAGRYDLLGQSFGACLAAEHAARRPSGMGALVLANGFADSRLFADGARRLCEGLPGDAGRVIAAHENSGTRDTESYQAAMGVFASEHLCRTQPWPAEMMRSMANFGEAAEVVSSVIGPSVFSFDGNLDGWSIIDRLSDIAAPTLAYRGAFDEVVEEAFAPFGRQIPNAEAHVFEQSSHMPHIEEPQACLALIDDFLRRAAS